MSSGKASSELARCRTEAIFAAESGEKEAVWRAAEQADTCARGHLNEASSFPVIGVVGSYPAIFDSGINDGLIAKIRDEGCQAVVPFASQLLAMICRECGAWPRFAGAIEEMLALFQGDYFAPIPINEEHSDIQDQVLPVDVATWIQFSRAGVHRIICPSWSVRHLLMQAPCLHVWTRWRKRSSSCYKEALSGAIGCSARIRCRYELR